MGRAARMRPSRLAGKLRQVRRALNLSQTQMIKQMGLSDKIVREEISDFERRKREPPLPILLEYARAAGVWVDVLIDDSLDLPDELPCFPRHEGVKRKTRVLSGSKGSK